MGIEWLGGGVLAALRQYGRKLLAEEKARGILPDERKLLERLK